MADHSIRIGIDSSEAKRGAVEVTNSLKSIQDAASKAVGRGKGIAVGIDSSGADAGARRIRASLREIQEQASRLSSKPISVKLDAAGMQEGVQRVSRTLREISGQSGKKISVGVDSSAAEAGTARIKASLDDIRSLAARKIPVNLDASGMEDAVAKASRSLREIGQKASGAGASVSMGASFDSSGADAGVAKLRKTIRDLQAEASKAAGSGKGIAVGIDASGAEAGAARVNRSLRDIIAQAAKVSNIPVKINVSGAQGVVGGVSRSLRDIKKEAQDSSGGLDMMSAAALGARSALGSIAGAFAAADLAKQVFEATSKVQDLETRFKTLTGSAEAAAETMQFLSDAANRLSVDSTALADSYSKLLPMVKDGTLSTQQARDMMIGLVDAQKATGASTAQLEQAMFGLAQTLGMPKANIEQLNQVTEPMPGLLGAMDRALGKLYPTAKQGAGAMREMVEEGRVTAQVFRDVTIKALQEYSGSAEATAGNLSAITARMKNAWNDLLNTIGQQIASPLSSVMEGMISLIQAVENGISRLASIGSTLKSSFDWMNPLDSIGSAWEKATAANPRPTAQVQGPAVAPATPPKPSPLGAAKPKSTKKTVGERFDDEKGNLEKQVALLEGIDRAYERGRGSVEQYRNAVSDLSKESQYARTYTREQTEALMELQASAKGLEEMLALKGAILDMQEHIDQTRQLADAYGQGTQAVKDTEAAQSAYNDALRLGMSGRADVVEQLTELQKAAQAAAAALAVAEQLSEMDVDIVGLEDLAGAYREQAGSLRDVTIAQEAYATAAQLGVQHDDAARAAIEARTRALYDARDAAEESQRVMESGFDLEQAERELDLINMTGEAREIEAVRIDMLMEKKRRLADATATLTVEEEKHAAAMGRVNAASQASSTELGRLATSIPNMAVAWDMAASGGLMHFEDALVDIVTGAKSAKEAFADMARAIAADLARMAIRMAIIQPLAMMFGGGGMFMGNAAMMGGGMMMGQRHTGGVIGADPAPMRRIAAFHTGGVVGSETPAMRSLPPISSWTRYHTGGLAGNEVPTILQKGEGVFTKGQMASLAPAGSGGSTNNITVNVAQDPKGTPGDAERQGRIIAQQIKQAVDERLIAARRPGGINNPTGY